MNLSLHEAVSAVYQKINEMPIEEFKEWVAKHNPNGLVTMLKEVGYFDKD